MIRLALSLLLLSSSVVNAATILPGTEVPEHRFVKIVPVDGERVFVFPLPSPTSPMTNVDVVSGADGCLYFVGPPGKYVVLWFGESAGEQGQTFVTIKAGSPDPNPRPKPDPVPPSPTDFTSKIKAAYVSIGSPSDSGRKVARVFYDIAESANNRRDIWKPALMIDEQKQRISSVLTVAELEKWRPFWPLANNALRDLGLESNDTDGFITAFRDLAKTLDPNLTAER